MELRSNLVKSCTKLLGLVLLFVIPSIATAQTTNIVSGGSADSGQRHLPNLYETWDVPIKNIPSSGNAEIDFNFAVNNLNNQLRPGCCNGNSSSLITVTMYVNGIAMWQTRSPNDDNVESGDLRVYGGATKISGPSVPYSVSYTCDDLRHRMRIRLPSSIGTIKTVRFTFAKGEDDARIRINSINVTPLPDCDKDGTPDAQEPDCDGDGIPDDCETDSNNNGIPDDCEPQIDAIRDQASTETNTPVTIDVLDNDQHVPSGGSLSITRQPDNGTVSINTNGTSSILDDTVTYTPNPGFVGDDFFRYRICDGNGNCDAARVDVTVAQNQNCEQVNVSYSPILANINYTTQSISEDVCNTLNVSKYDAVDVQYTSNCNGVIEYRINVNGYDVGNNSCGSFPKRTFTNPSSLNVSAQFVRLNGASEPWNPRFYWSSCQYRFEDNGTGIYEGYLKITGRTTTYKISSQPVFSLDNLPTNHDSYQSVGVSSSLSNVRFTLGGNFTISGSQVYQNGSATGITVTGNNTNNIRFTGIANVSTYKAILLAIRVYSSADFTTANPNLNIVTSATALDCEATLEAVNDMATTIEDQPLDIHILNNDQNVPTSGSLSITTPPTHGTVTLDQNGTPNNPSDDKVIYTPNPNYVGNDSFTYQLCDSNGTCDTAQVQITVTEDGDGDNDEDGIEDSIDIDDDNDGILDTVEGDGTIDTDGDGIPDSKDIDSDNDGIPDNIEAQTTIGYIPPTNLDSDHDGLDNSYEGSGNEGLTPVDTDTDGTPDVVDLDSDNDNVPDANEGHDHNFDGIPDALPTGNDTDRDGLDDGYEGNNVNDGFDVNDEINNPGRDLPNTDGAEDVNYRDIDDDGDGLLTVDEDVNGDGNPTNDDSNNDGIPDYLDPKINTPDLGVSLQIFDGIANGPEEQTFIFKIKELAGTATFANGIIEVRVDRSDDLSFNYDQILSSISIAGNTIPLNNGNWTYDGSDPLFHKFSTAAPIAALQTSTFAFIARFDPNNATGKTPFTARIKTGSGGESNPTNNVDTEVIAFFPN